MNEAKKHIVPTRISAKFITPGASKRIMRNVVSEIKKFDVMDRRRTARSIEFMKRTHITH